MNQNLRRILLSAALAGLPYVGKLTATPVSVYDWVPVGDAVESTANGDSFADTSSAYVHGDFISTDAPNASTYNSDFASSSALPTLNVYGSLYNDAPGQGGTQVLDGENPIACPLKVDGVVTLDATANNMTVNIKENVIIEAFFQAPSSTDGVTESTITNNSQIYFKTSASAATSGGNVITVNVDHSLEFRGQTGDAAHKDLLLVFAGAGKVVFNMADGTKVVFNGQIDTSGAQSYDPETGTFSNNVTPSCNAGGTKVMVLMDQTQEQVVTNGYNKLVFQRKDVASADNSQRVLIEVGPNSTFSYGSSDATGADTSIGGYAAVGFDPSNDGAGRMVLLIDGAYALDTDALVSGSESEANPNFNALKTKYPFNDGAVVVAGHFVGSMTNSSLISEDPSVGSGETPSTGYSYAKPAGIRAIMRVVDSKYAAAHSGEAAAPTVNGGRRGLLVVNDVVSHGKLMADPYWDVYASFAGSAWAATDPNTPEVNKRKGFVLGVNGMVDVYHNMFMHHCGGANNVVDPLAYADWVTTSGSSANVLKRRNPSAFMVDGLDPSVFVNGNVNGDVSLFEAADPFTQVSPVTAAVQLRGSGALYLSNTGSARYGNQAFRHVEDDPVNNVSFDWTAGLQVGSATAYDGYLLGSNDDTIATGEGAHVVDVEGPLAVRSVANAAPGRSYTDEVTGSGVFNAAALPLNHRGLEVNGSDVLTRPLLADGTTYFRYNSPTLFLNNNAAFYNTLVRHNEPTHYVDGLPKLSEPGITGGERLFFNESVADSLYDPAANRVADPERFRFPELQLFNSTLELMESVNASGMRFVVKDIPGLADASGNNTATIKMFDHGDPLDTMLTGFGRIFMCGSSLNLMSDPTATDANNFATDSCCVNVYKRNSAASVDSPATVKLSFANGDQFHPAIQTVLDGLSGQAVLSFKAKQRAHHLVMFAQQAALAAGTQPTNQVTGLEEASVCNMAAGWQATVTRDNDSEGLSAPAGEGANLGSGNIPAALPYPGREPVVSSDASIYNTSPFSLDGNTVPQATISVDGSVICFGSFDGNGNSLPLPVATDDDNGVVYVKHGGKMTVTRPAGSDRVSIPSQAVFSTILAQRIWNDYNSDGNARSIFLSGAVDLPSDQVVFDRSFAVQPYNFTSTMFAARRDTTSGYVRLSGYNAARNPVRDRAGIEEELIGWFYKANPDYTVSVDGTSNNIQIKGGKLQGRAVVAAKHAKRAKVSRADNSRMHLRSTESIGAPVARPTDLLYVGPGDDIKQLRVAGATMSDPFVLDISGDGVYPVGARIREFTSQKTTRDQKAANFISEGAHATLLVEYGGRFGLGSLAQNSHSVDAWNILGRDFVTVAAFGQGTIDVNSNIIIADRQALVAGDTFGASQVDRLTFYSSTPREIRVATGGELDLSSFGQAANLQQIAFGGKVSLIIEAGATIRFPSSPTGGVALYFSDEAELRFEGVADAGVYLPFTDESDATNAPSANARTRIVGKGQIWGNKNARIRVNGAVTVGVETDSLTPDTDVLISLSRQSRMDLGDENVAGGAFQVGNPVAQDSATIAFNMTLRDASATLHIDREGFFGLGAGITNKSGKPNGNASAGTNPVLADSVIVGNAAGNPVFNPSVSLSSGVWRVNSLSNVTSIALNLTNGIFEHKNIGDGTNSAASLIAVGPASTYVWKQGVQSVVSVRGGGNVMLVPADGLKYSVNIWDYAGPLTDEAISNPEARTAGTRYGVLASGPLLLDRSVDLSANFNPSTGFTFDSGDRAAGMFNLLSFRPFNDQSVHRIVVGQNTFGTQSAYSSRTSAKYNNADAANANRAEIVRGSSPSLSFPSGTSLADAMNPGAVLAGADLTSVATGGVPGQLTVTK